MIARMPLHGSYNGPTIDLFSCNQEAVQALEEAKDGSLSSTTIINEILEKLQELK